MCNVHCTYMFCTECSGRGHWCSVVHLFCRLHNPTLSKIEVTTIRPVQRGDLDTILEIQCHDFAVCCVGWPGQPWPSLQNNLTQYKCLQECDLWCHLTSLNEALAKSEVSPETNTSSFVELSLSMYPFIHSRSCWLLIIVGVMKTGVLT